MSPDLSSSVNYYQRIADQMMPYLGDHILDIGGGYGSHLEHILKHNRRVVSIDLSEESVRYMSDRFKGYANFEAIRADLGHGDVQKSIAKRGFYTIVCVNVLEHMEDQLSFLKAMRATLKGPRGTLFLLVPAHEWLYGSLDAQAGHDRRYSTSQLRKVLTSSGFGIVRLYYFNSFGVLPWLVNARILRRSLDAESVGFQIKVFDRYLVPILRKIESHVSLPVGQSAIAVARVSGD